MGCTASSVSVGSPPAMIDSSPTSAGIPRSHGIKAECAAASDVWPSCRDGGEEMVERGMRDGRKHDAHA